MTCFSFCCLPDLTALNPEVKGLLYATGARAPLFINLLFLSTAMLQYSNISANCTPFGGYEIVHNESTNALQTYEEADRSEVECSGTVLLGMRPTSVLSALSSIGSLVCALILPLFGAVIDHTSYRRPLFKLTFIIFWGANFIQGFMNQDNWEFILILQGFGASWSYMGFSVVR